MRDIKFRFWDKKFNCFDYDLFITANGSLFEYAGFTYDTPNIEIKMVKSEDYIIMQYTGLKDINGNDIYEGDIIKAREFNPPLFKVEFIEGGFCGVDLRGKNLYPVDINMFYPSIGCQIEVVGNVYEVRI